MLQSVKQNTFNKKKVIDENVIRSTYYESKRYLYPWN